MTELKLPVLPDRTPVKLSIHIVPELAEALQDYAKLYASTYGREEPVSVLVPAMLEAFLSSDRSFVRARGRGGR
ncbi:DUF2274 domain-containing protein [Novosphingobium sp. BL-8A]|uniref:DUF2274 domain-containing protein n=1 Tax=Novosphingobium sp. BL-8A TaxID=3127639 RepID=UPI003757CB10